MPKTLTLGEVAERWGWELQGDPTLPVSGINTLKRAANDEVSFLDNLKYRHDLAHTRAAAVLLKSEYAAQCPVSALLTPNPYLAFAQLANFWGDGKSGTSALTGLLTPGGRHPTAVIHPSAELAEDVTVGPHVVVEAEVHIGAGTVLGAGCVIGRGCVLGEHVWLHPRVTLYPKVCIGAHSCVHSGVVLGSDGFAFANNNGEWVKIPQKGGVWIGEHVEIGANTTIDCGALEDTYIGHGVKLDNQIQIGHNVRIGDHTAVAGCVGIAGSTHIGKYCMIGGGAGIAGHLRIADRVILAGMSMVTHHIEKPGTYASGTGLLPAPKWRKSAIRFRQLDDWGKRLASLEKQVKLDT